MSLYVKTAGRQEEGDLETRNDEGYLETRNDVAEMSDCGKFDLKFTHIIILPLENVNH